MVASEVRRYKTTRQENERIVFRKLKVLGGIKVRGYSWIEISANAGAAMDERAKMLRVENFAVA